MRAGARLCAAPRAWPAAARAPGRAAMRAGPLLILLAGCVQGGEGVARDAAKSVIGRTVATRYPDLPVQPAVDCVIDNATNAEVLALASDTVTGPNAATTETVLAIVSRPGTLTCLAAGRAAWPN